MGFDSVIREDTPNVEDHLWGCVTRRALALLRCSLGSTPMTSTVA
jgi:hypothetical protein